MKPTNAAAALLAGLKARGVDYLFSGSGSDWAPIIEAYADPGMDKSLLPQPVICPHETAVVAMAHGYYLRTGKPQAAMVHVNVGLANAAMGMLNAAADRIPLIMLSGRSPVSDGERTGARNEPIHWGQDMRDQTALVRESAKWDVEMRYGEQALDVAARATAIAASEPTGPVYVSLPREALCEPWSGKLDLGRMRKAVSSARRIRTPERWILPPAGWRPPRIPLSWRHAATPVAKAAACWRISPRTGRCPSWSSGRCATTCRAAIPCRPAMPCRPGSKTPI